MENGLLTRERCKVVEASNAPEALVIWKKRTVEIAASVDAENTAEDRSARWDSLITAYSIFQPEMEGLIEHSSHLVSILDVHCGSGTPLTILDVACGTGRIALPLAARGHSVTAIDCSRSAIEFVQREATKCGLKLNAGVHDMRFIGSLAGDQYDAVLILGNSLCQLESVAEMIDCLQGLHSKLKPNGFLLIGIRAYARDLQKRKLVDGPIFCGAPGNRRSVLQAWDWEPDGIHYNAHIHIGKEIPGEWIYHNNCLRLRATLPEELIAALEETGFEEITCISNDAGGPSGGHERFDEVYISAAARKSGEAGAR